MAAYFIFRGIVCILNYMYEQPEAMFRVVWHDFYENQENIDTLCLGSSHVYCGIDAVKLSSLSGKCHFNLSTPGQMPKGSYYLLREADRYHKLEHVYLELGYAIDRKDYFESDADYSHNWSNTDNMKLSFNKLAYMLSIGGADRYIDIFLPFSRYRANLDNWEYVKWVIEEKQQEDYLNYRIYHNDGDHYSEYRKGGYSYSTGICPDEEKIYEQIVTSDNMRLGEEPEKYVRKIVLYCQKRDIPITLFIAPVDHLQLISTQNYDNYVEDAKELAAEYNVPFYDFNLAREEYLPVWSEDGFGDLEHLNGNGAALFTSFFYQVVSREASENEKYFYGSYAEKLLEIPPAVYGIYYRNDKEADRTMWIASNRENNIEYSITMQPNGGEPYTVQTFCENKEFTVSPNESGVCTITARMADSLEEIQTLQIAY